MFMIGLLIWNLTLWVVSSQGLSRCMDDQKYLFHLPQCRQSLRWHKLDKTTERGKHAALSRVWKYLHFEKYLTDKTQPLWHEDINCVDETDEDVARDVVGIKRMTAVLVEEDPVDDGAERRDVCVDVGGDPHDLVWQWQPGLRAGVARQQPGSCETLIIMFSAPPPAHQHSFTGEVNHW